MKSHYFVIWSLYQPIRMPKTSKSCEKMRDLTKNYFHLNSSAVYNSSVKKSNISTMEEVHTKNKFTQDVHTYWWQFWCQISRWPKLVKNTFYLHFEGFWWSWYVMSKLMSMSVNHIMSINFFVNLLHSLPVCFFDIWHLFDNLTSFDIFIAVYIIWGNVIISHLSVHLSIVGYPILGYLPWLWGDLPWESP